MVGWWVRAARVMGRLLGSVTGTSVQGLTTSKDGSLVQPLTSTGDWHPSLCVARGGMWDICLGLWISPRGSLCLCLAHRFNASSQGIYLLTGHTTGECRGEEHLFPVSQVHQGTI